MTSQFYSRTLFHPLPVVNAVSIFRNDKKYICSPRCECPVPSGQFQLFLSCGFVIIKKLLVNMVNRENICTMVDVFDKAIAAEAR